MASKQVGVEYVNTEDNLAYVRTKGLSRDRHFYLIHKLGLADLSVEINQTKGEVKSAVGVA